MGRKKIKEIKEFDKSNIKYYYGIPHCHTEFSTGKGSPMEAYEYAYRDRLNFLFITDHNSHLSKEIKIKENINIITPGLNLVLGDPYEIVIERVIPNVET